MALTETKERGEGKSTHLECVTLCQVLFGLSGITLTSNQICQTFVPTLHQCLCLPSHWITKSSGSMTLARACKEGGISLMALGV